MKKVLISGGGTGGHIYPALSLIRQLKKQAPDTEFLYVGTKRGLESTIVPQAGIPFETIEIQGFKRSLSLENLRTIRLFLKSIGRAKQLIREFQPDIVLGTGGYVSAAIVYAAHRLHVPTIIHEQNSVPGLTNKFLARFVDKVAICFKTAADYFPAKKIVITGNPRAQEVVEAPRTNSLAEYGLHATAQTVLVFGGSQGALRLNETMTACLPAFSAKPYQVLFVTGERYYEKVMASIEGASFDTVKVVPYVPQMEKLLAEIQLMVGRAGATSLAEITGLGIPSVLIPSPNVTNDHQTKNAKALVEQKAAVLLPESELTPETLIASIDSVMLAETKLQQMAEAAQAAGIPDAADRLIAVMEELIAQ